MIHWRDSPTRTEGGDVGFSQARSVPRDLPSCWREHRRARCRAVEAIVPKLRTNAGNADSAPAAASGDAPPTMLGPLCRMWRNSKPGFLKPAASPSVLSSPSSKARMRKGNSPRAAVARRVVADNADYRPSRRFQFDGLPESDVRWTSAGRASSAIPCRGRKSGSPFRRVTQIRQ